MWLTADAVRLSIKNWDNWIVCSQTKCHIWSSNKELISNARGEIPLIYNISYLFSEDIAYYSIQLIRANHKLLKCGLSESITYQEYTRTTSKFNSWIMMLYVPIVFSSGFEQNKFIVYVCVSFEMSRHLFDNNYHNYDPRVINELFKKDTDA